MRKLSKGTRRVFKRATIAARQGIVERSPAWARRLLGPAAANLDMLLLDHGVFRLLYLNAHRLGHRAWRSAQPAPVQLARFARRGVRTVINLRGPSEAGSYWLEEAACRRLGLKLVNFQIRSRAAPEKAELHAAHQLFRSVEYPILMHCKSGADRAGLMSVLYLHWQEGVPIAEARRALSLRFGHFRQADTGILDALFDRYLADTAGAPVRFLDWVDTRYDPDELAASFRAQGWANRIVDTVLRRE